MTTYGTINIWVNIVEMIYLNDIWKWQYYSVDTNKWPISRGSHSWEIMSAIQFCCVL